MSGLKVTEVVVSRTAKINHGNYESTDLFLSAKAENPEGVTSADIEKVAKSVEESMLQWLIRIWKLKGTATTPMKLAKHFGLALAPSAKKTS